MTSNRRIFVCWRWSSSRFWYDLLRHGRAVALCRSRSDLNGRAAGIIGFGPIHGIGRADVPPSVARAWTCPQGALSRSAVLRVGSAAFSVVFGSRGQIESHQEHWERPRQTRNPCANSSCQRLISLVMPSHASSRRSHSFALMSSRSGVTCSSTNYCDRFDVAWLHDSTESEHLRAFADLEICQPTVLRFGRTW